MLEKLILMMVPGYFLFSSAGAALGSWGLFTKAGEPGWAALVPGYNLFVLARISGMSPFWALLFVVPAANMFLWYYICDQLAMKFGKGIGTSLGLMFLAFIFFPLLGFGPGEYEDHAKRSSSQEPTRRNSPSRQPSPRRV